MKTLPLPLRKNYTICKNLTKRTLFTLSSFHTMPSQKERFFTNFRKLIDRDLYYFVSPFSGNNLKSEQGKTDA